MSKESQIVTYIVLRLNNIHQHFRVFHRVSSLNLSDTIHKWFDVCLQELQVIQYGLPLLCELLGHTFRQVQTFTDVGGVVNHVSSVDCLEHKVEENIFVVNLMMRKDPVRLENQNIPRLTK